MQDLVAGGAHLGGAEVEARGEHLAARQRVGRPVERVAAVVDRRAALRRVVHRAQVLPLARPHLRARLRRARRLVREQRHDDRVRLLDQQPTQLVQPDLLARVRRRARELARDVRRDGREELRVGGVGVRVVQRLEVFRQRKRGVDLEQGHQRWERSASGRTASYILEIDQRWPFAHDMGLGAGPDPSRSASVQTSFA
nr:hypothetical protein CFP56_11181 [Quercus suber]